MPNDLLMNLDQVHTMELGAARIRKNLGLPDSEDVVQWCKAQISNPDSITRTGKNWYVRGDGFVITVNAHSYTIITAHREKPKKGSDMRDVGIIRKLDDVPELRKKLIRVFDTKTHRGVSRYGLLLADHILRIADIPADEVIAACSCYGVNWNGRTGPLRSRRRVTRQGLFSTARAKKKILSEKRHCEPSLKSLRSLT